MQDFFEVFYKILLATAVTEVMARPKSSPQGAQRKRRLERLLLPVFAVNHTLDPVPHVNDMEINQQPNSDAAQAHI